VGSGKIRVDDALVRVTGRRFGVFVGLPSNVTDKLGWQIVVNVETQGRAVRFELRVPDHKVRGLTVWLPSEAEAKELAEVLPSARTADFTPQLVQHVEFEQALIAQSPKTPVTYALMVICVCVYVVTALGTYHYFSIDGGSLVRVGSNYGPFTTSGDWWRLATAVFLHAGVVHLTFNMWALASFGPVVERLYGSPSYALLYGVAGIAGSLASVSLSPAVNSVGASGAIMGVLGALIAAQIRSSASIPKSIVRPLRNSSLIYVGVTLFAGFSSSEVDNAAHVGGVTAGFLLGLALARPVTGQRLDFLRLYRRLALAAGMSCVLLGLGVSTAKSASERLKGEALYEATVNWFAPGEHVAALRWHTLGHRAKDEKWNEDTFATRIESEVIPFWREADARFLKVELPTNAHNTEELKFLRTVAQDRLHAYELMVQALRKNDDTMRDEARQELKNTDDLIHERAKEIAARQ
jgi:rhomboid protease GluP